MNIPLYYRTIRHLKFIQIFNRIARKVHQPKIRQDAVPEIASDAAEQTAWKFCDAPRVFDGREFTFLNRTIPIKAATDWNSCCDDKLWLYNLHYFDFLKQPEYRNHPESFRWIERWIRENPPFSGNGWEPYPLSLRIVNWIKWLKCGNTPSEGIRQSLILQVRHLVRSLEYHLLANHLMANAKALIFAGSCFSGPEAEELLKLGWKIYRAQIQEQILNDGGHFERSVMYHSIILEDLLDVHQLTGARELIAPIEKMLFFLEGMTFPDRRIALFNDAAYRIAPEPDSLFHYAERLGFQHPAPLREGFTDFPESGYGRLHFANWDLIFDAGPVGPDYQPGHAHADTFSFELSCRGKKIITDTGTSCYKGEERLYQRGTAAHNTIRIDEKNSSEVWSSHRVGARARILRRQELPGGFCAEHDGYAPIRHRRSWFWKSDAIEIEDEFSERGDKKHKVELFLHFMPEETLQRRSSNEFLTKSGILITLPEGGETELLPTEMGLEFGRKVPNQTLKTTFESALPLKLRTRIAH